MSNQQIANLIKSVASRISGFVYNVPPDNLIDAKAVMGAALEHFKPACEEELLLLLEKPGTVRGTKEYRELQRLYRFPCWHRVSEISIDVLHNAAHFREHDDNSVFVACSYPHAANGDLPLSLPVSDEHQDKFLSERTVTSLAQRAAKVFSGHGVMRMDGGSEHISPFRYTICHDKTGRIDTTKVATGLTLLYTDQELQNGYHTVLWNAKRTLARVRLANPEFFETLPNNDRDLSQRAIYIPGDPTTRH